MTVLPRPDYWGRLGVAGPTSALVGSYARKPKSIALMKVNHPLFSHFIFLSAPVYFNASALLYYAVVIFKLFLIVNLYFSLLFYINCYFLVCSTEDR